MAELGSTDPLTRLVEVAEEQLRWQRAAALPEVRKIIDETLLKTRMRRAYELLDGDRTNSDIGATVGASEASMSVWTHLWRDLGIAYQVTNKKGQKRIKQLVSLEALGLPLEIDEG